MIPLFFPVRGKVAKIDENKVGVSCLLETADGNRLVVDCNSEISLRVGDIVEGSGKLLGITKFQGQILATARSNHLKMVSKKRDGRDDSAPSARKPSIAIDAEGTDRGVDHFIGARHNVEAGEAKQAETHLNFGDFSMLAEVMTPERLELMKLLRQHGPLCIHALASLLKRDYKSVYADVSALENINIIQRTDEDLLLAPWDVIDAHVRLVP